MVTVETHSMVRTSKGTIPGGTKAGLPREEAEKLERAGHLTIVEDDGGDEADDETMYYEDHSEEMLASDDEESADTDIDLDDYNDLRSATADLEDRTGIEPEDYKKATLQDYVKKHGE